ncbi:BTAD domain-containing putative transcriptional regulator [Saccharothrix syringae]|nr:BTAD domain-containing putative transcriptional regulator [Saccharothrix syringae]
MLQNAVWSLRALLAVDKSPTAPKLLTQAPGYLLQVDPEQVDLHEFHRKADRGRAELTAGTPERAARTLREALAMWRGAPLADLVETGIAWPELTVVSNARLDVMEDYFEAELACGRHQAVLGELEAMVEAERLRERSCGQLMLALYRCGRHADALNVYQRLRQHLVDELGLEPGPALQKLQQAILGHDPSLVLPEREAPAPVAVPQVVDRDPVAAAAPPPAPVAIPFQPGGAPQHRHMTVALIQTWLRDGSCDVADAPEEEVDHALAAVSAMVRAGIEELGGTVATSIGSASLALFGYPGTRQEQEAVAVRAALALRDCLASARLAVHVALVTGNALVFPQPQGHGGPPTVSGRLVDQARHLLHRVPQDEVWICDRTRALAGEALVCAPAEGGAWRVECAASTASRDTAPEGELLLVRGMLDRTLRRGTPHLVTALGEADEAMGPFLAGVRHCAEQEPAGPLVLTGVASADDHLSAAAQVLAAYCGIEPHESPDSARAKLARACERVLGCDGHAVRLLPLLQPGHGVGPATARGTLAAWRAFLRLAALHRPLVLDLRDLHLADDDLLDAVECLVDDTEQTAPLLVVASARLSLLDRRPDWGGGKQHAATITLTPQAGRTSRGLRRAILSAVDDSTGRLLLAPKVPAAPTRVVHRRVVRAHCHEPGIDYEAAHRNPAAGLLPSGPRGLTPFGPRRGGTLPLGPVGRDSVVGL